MTVQTAPNVNSVPSAGPAHVIPIEDLITCSGDLKRKWVAFAQSPRFARRLEARLNDAGDRHGSLDEGLAVRTINHFVLQHRLPDGCTVLDVFVEQRRPLPDDERQMMLGWRDVVEGCFEVRQLDGGAAVLHNLLDDVVWNCSRPTASR